MKKKEIGKHEQHIEPWAVVATSQASSSLSTGMVSEPEVRSKWLKMHPSPLEMSRSQVQV